MNRRIISSAAAALLCAGPAFAGDAATDARIDALARQVEVQAAQIKKLEAQAGPAASPAGSDTSIGGYGEIAYNAYDKDASRNQADLKRFVLFLGHRFSERWSFNSEVEWEHAVTSADDEGEAEIEQAYLNYQFGGGVNVKAGLFLMPFGFINTSHEPPVFHGVERNEVETRIIPSTWREGGVSVGGVTGFGLAAEAGVVTGFDVAKFDDPSSPLRGIHQELQLAKARDLSFYGALNYRGVPGMTLGGALFTGNSAQGNADFKADPAAPDYAGIDARVTLWETHARWQGKGLDLQALYAAGAIGQAAGIDRMLDAFNTANPGDERPFVAKRFTGWLTQAAYTVWQRGDASVTPFVRYERFDAQAGMPAGLASDPADADKVVTYGISFKPLSQVVFKVDRQRFKDQGANDRTNIGLGYMF